MHTVCFNAHVRGASHEATGAVCQDYSGSCEVVGSRGVGSVAVVADGHGDKTCRRSDRGSKIAVGVVLDYLGSVAKTYVNADDESWHGMNAAILGEDASKSLRGIAINIVSSWQEAIFADYEDDPIEELAEALEKSDKEHREKAIRRLYGTTLVFALMLPDLCIVGQQGDGCATAIFADGSVPPARADVVPEDPLCIGNITTSLSDKDAQDRMRIAVLDGEKSSIAAMFVGTDGVDKSLPGEDGVSNLFSGIALDVLSRVEQDAFVADDFNDDIAGLLDEVSRSGSGDDASMAGIVDTGLLGGVANALRTERNQFDLRASIDANNAKLASMSRRYEYYKTYIPTSEEEAEERDQYLRDYDNLQKQVEGAKRDLGMAADDGESTADSSCENELQDAQTLQNNLAEDPELIQEEAADAQLEGFGSCASIEEEYYEADAALASESVATPINPLRPVREPEKRGLINRLYDAVQTIPLWALIVFVAMLTAICVFLALSLQHESNMSRETLASAIIGRWYCLKL